MFLIQIGDMNDQHPGLLFRTALNFTFAPCNMNDLVHQDTFTTDIMCGYGEGKHDLTAGWAGYHMIYPGITHRKGKGMDLFCPRFKDGLPSGEELSLSRTVPKHSFIQILEK